MGVCRKIFPLPIRALLFTAQTYFASNLWDDFDKGNRVNLTLPMTLELQSLELPVLLDKLSEQTSLYFKLLHQEGFSDNTTACKKILLAIQAAVQSKLDLEKANNNESDFQDH